MVEPLILNVYVENKVVIIKNKSYNHSKSPHMHMDLPYQSMTLGTSPMPPTSKNKSRLVKVSVHLITSPNFLSKCLSGLVADEANVTDCCMSHDNYVTYPVN